MEGRDEALTRRVEERERKRKEREADRIRTRFGGEAKIYLCNSFMLTSL